MNCRPRRRLLEHKSVKAKMIYWRGENKAPRCMHTVREEGKGSQRDTNMEDIGSKGERGQGLQIEIRPVPECV